MRPSEHGVLLCGSALAAGFDHRDRYATICRSGEYLPGGLCTFQLMSPLGKQMKRLPWRVEPVGCMILPVRLLKHNFLRPRRLVSVLH